jgi:hypothetical protein
MLGPLKYSPPFLSSSNLKGLTGGVLVVGVAAGARSCPSAVTHLSWLGIRVLYGDQDDLYAFHSK